MIAGMHEFSNRQDLAKALLRRIRDWSAGHDGPHRLELSGGSTPKELLAALADWAPGQAGDGNNPFCPLMIAAFPLTTSILISACSVRLWGPQICAPYLMRRRGFLHL